LALPHRERQEYGLLTFLKKLFNREEKKRLSEAEVSRLRTLFQERYHSFKLLLSANNRALELMTEMEQALRGEAPFGMSFIRSHTTAVSANVYRIIDNLCRLAPGRYDPLKERFTAIQKEITSLLDSTAVIHGTELILPLEALDRDMADQTGGKMACLGEVSKRLGLPIPSGFVLTARAYTLYMEENGLQEEINRLIQQSEIEAMDSLFALSASIQGLITKGTVPRSLRDGLLSSYDRLAAEHGSGVKVSMRSSALGEDVLGHSFAGQYRSELNVSRESLVSVYKDILASKYSVQAMSYRFQRGLRDEDVAMCVGVMVMVQAVAGGVVYTRNPNDIRDLDIHITSTWGLAKAIVDGRGGADVIRVSRDPLTIRERRIGRKEFKYQTNPKEGISRTVLPEDQAASLSIDDQQALRLADFAARLEDHFGSPQDVEWSVDQEGKLYILQTRPLSQEISEEEEGLPVPLPASSSELLLKGGETASRGVAFGTCFPVLKDADALQFPAGAILVSRQSLPKWAALLGRASAVVTEQGSTAGHLANVAREFNTPALFSVPRAVEILQKGMEITVDATGRRIFPGKVECLLQRPRRKPALMLGSPVHNLLTKVSEHIVPLHLLDPNSTDFKAHACRTYHDITRFCHEKSVHEMFRFGQDHDFSERASKQLMTTIPMQWWFINLDDGFKEEVEGRFVHLENIVSIPMLALWRGITAVPWEGPPVVDSRGFMSVLLEASTNPHLEPSRASDFANKNYFMVSRHYCNLQSRFGFHLCTVEALVGPRSIENYVRFVFTGGAADYCRRLRRARMVGELLEEFGFHVRLHEDSLRATIEGYDQQTMEERLIILGHLLIHTRQVDMIMSNTQQVHSYKEKLLSDITSLRKGVAQ
jgi:pyruvate, water dikinase